MRFVGAAKAMGFVPSTGTHAALRRHGDDLRPRFEVQLAAAAVRARPAVLAVRTISTLETRRTCLRRFTRLDYCIGLGMVRIGFAILASLWLGVAAANNDDGFVWVDANTKIRIKPVGAAGGAGSGRTAPAPEPRKEEKKEEPKK